MLTLADIVARQPDTKPRGRHAVPWSADLVLQSGMVVSCFGPDLACVVEAARANGLWCPTLWHDKPGHYRVRIA